MKELIFHRLLLPAVERFTDATAFVDEGSGTSVTYGGHLDRISRLSSGLRDLGVKPGDRVAVLAANSLAYMELWHTAFLGTAVLNPLNTRFSPEELAFVLADSGTKVVVVDRAFAEVVDSVREKAGIESVILTGGGDAPHDVDYEALLDGGDPELPPEPEETDPVVLMYTGGTTGLPKGVLIEQRAEILNQYHWAMAYPWAPEAPFLSQTPLFHGASMLGILGAPTSGATTVVMPGFEPGAVIDVIERHGIAMTVMIPTMVNMMLSHPAFAPERVRTLRRLLYGGSPMPTALLERTLAACPDLELVQGYGMTEGCTILTALTGADHRRPDAPLTSAGRALPGVQLRIEDEDGTVLPAGAVGEVCARGGNFMREYWNRPEESAAALRGGWYHTGDVGYLDDKGYLFLVDRSKDMIVSGGENVYSAEVENSIASHPAVAQVAVIGIPDDTWGEAVHAVVVLKSGAAATDTEIIEHARRSIGGYKVPKSVTFREEPLPMSAAMKVLKRELRAPFWEGRGRAIN